MDILNSLELNIPRSLSFQRFSLSLIEDATDHTMTTFEDNVATREFVNLYDKRDSIGLFQPSLPRFPILGPFIHEGIPNPSEKFIPFSQLGKNLDDVFLGYSMANSKIRCVERDKILFREDYFTMKDKVRIISSGIGLWADYVGQGMLTCMVLGTNESPKPRVIFTALRELSKTADAGMIAIVPNNYDDKLNWGIALARAYRKKIPFERIIFGDNAYEGCKVDERDCLPGIVLLFKLAGAMSEEKFTLPMIMDRLQNIFFSTMSCHFSDAIRVGTDLKGNGGKTLDTEDKAIILEEMLPRLLDSTRRYSVAYEPNVEFVIFINVYVENWSLQQILAKDVLDMIFRMGFQCARVYSGHLIPSVSDGFSITILPECDQDIIRWLDSYTVCRGWLGGGTGEASVYELNRSSSSIVKKGAFLYPDQVEIVKKVIQLTAANFKASEGYLNRHDPKEVYGTKMCSIAESILADTETNGLLLKFPFVLFLSLAEKFEETFDNKDGLMFALFSITMGQYFGDHDRPKRVSSKFWQRALRRSVKSVAGYFKVGYKDNTILDIFGSLYLIIVTSGLELLTDLHLALEVGEEQCWKAKTAKNRKIIEYPHLTMKSACIILGAITTVVREKTLSHAMTAQEIDTTPTATAEKIKGILTS